MPFAADRHCSRATQYVCSQCDYTTFDVGNRNKHARKVHNRMETRHVWYGLPILLRKDRGVELERTKRFLFKNHVCPWTTDGFEYLVKRLDTRSKNVDWHAQNLKIIFTMGAMLDITWSRDVVEFAKPNPLRNVFKWDGSVFWYRTKCGESARIDDFELLEFPDTVETYQYLAYELFKLVRRLYEWVTTTTIPRYKKPNALHRWKTVPFRDIETERVLGGEVTGYAWWMKKIREDIEFYIGNQHYVVRNDKYVYPSAVNIDPDIQQERHINVLSCTHCLFASQSAYKLNRHVKTCKRRLNVRAPEGPPTKFTAAWYTEEEIERLDPFSARTGSSLDIIRERCAGDGQDAARLEFARSGLSQRDRARLTLDLGLDTCVLACFDVFYGKHAARPEFQTFEQFGRHAVTFETVDGKQKMKMMVRGDVLSHVIGNIRELLVAAGRGDEETVTSIHEAFVSHSFDPGLAERVASLIPTHSNVISYLGPLK
jgi:hypothetical protein